MGGCLAGLTPEEKNHLDQSKLIDKNNRDDQLERTMTVKLLLLGTGESGKSTIFKQMRILYGQGFSDSEKLRYKLYIWNNILETAINVCIATEAFGYLTEIEDENTLNAFNLFYSMSGAELVPLTLAHVEAINILWNNATIQKTISRRNEIQMHVSFEHFFPRLNQIVTEEYVPNVEDMLLARVRTTGIIIEEFFMHGRKFNIVDVGGQRNERRKWMHCFCDANAIVFVVALSEFDQVLFEDHKVNRMVDSIALFSQVCNNKDILGVPIILFLNKSDLFKAKIANSNLADIPQWKDYSGSPFSYDEGAEYFLQKFIAANNDTTRSIYHHTTCATDTNNIQFVWSACTHIILKQQIEELGFAF